MVASTPSDSLQAFLSAASARVEAALERGLPAVHIQPRHLHEAMRYAVLGGGKRIRPALVYGVGEILGVPAEKLDSAACALECIHAYSLVHDDLPAMDDDDLRRGRPTCHKAFDEATAILAGDALQSLAFQLLARDVNLPEGARLKMIETLALAAGSRGMAGGQALDLAAEGQEIDLAQLELIHIHKTGALIRASVRLPVLAVHDEDSEAGNRLDRYAKCLGLAFQVQDDLLDVEGDGTITGKGQGKDQRAGKATYPSLIGLEAAHRTARELMEEALESLGTFDHRADPLRDLARFVVQRSY